MELQKNKSNEIVDAWSKPKPIKILFDKNKVEFSEDGIAVKLNADIEARNSQLLKNSVVIKVLGNNAPFSVCSTELRKQWSRFGGFHLTSIGMDWILCSFQSSEVVDEVLNGGPWYVNGFIVGMDKWLAAFDPNTFKGISAPVWCWDEDNIARIASCLGTPMYIDGNTCRWSKGEFARVCVRIDLEKKLLNGVWVDGSAGRFFQRVEYEKIELLSYQCGRVGHNREICPENVSIGIQNLSLKEKEVGKEIGEKNVQENKSSVINSKYGPWIHVHFKDRRYNRGNVVRKGLNEAKLDKSFREDNSRNNNAKAYKESMVNKKDIVDTNDVLASDSRDVRKSIGKEKLETAVTNRFNVLSEDPEEAGLVEKVSDFKNTENDRECIEDDINHSELAVSCAAVKVKLAKELKSLGPVNVENKKKKRGARKKEASLYLKEILRDHSIFFIGLMETKLASICRKHIDYLIGKDWEYFHHPAEGTSGGIMVLWKRNMVSFDIRETSSQAIVGSLSVPNLGTWRIATVYGSRNCKERESLWKQLNDCMEVTILSIIGGDFNCIIDKEEKRGGKRFLFSKGPREMKSFMVNSDFHDIGSMGPRFTWCNNKEGTSRIWERLDRCILNSIAIQMLPMATIKHLARVASDHSPIVLSMKDRICGENKVFKFEDTWRSYPAAKNFVYNSWMKNDYGDEYSILQRKLKRTMKALFFWNRNKCKNLNVLKETLKKEILDLQNREACDVSWNADDLVLLRNKVHELNVTLRRLSTWWNQRAKVKWHEDGDTNSSFFQNFASARRNGNRINQVKDRFNTIQVEENQIEKVFADFFEKKWQQRNCILSGWPAIEENQKVNNVDLAMLNEEFSVQELHTLVFQQGNNKAPGFDGVTSSFYKSYWSIVWKVLWNAVNYYWPISRCQTNYKIVSSMLVNRLKKVIDKMVYEEQAAFIPGRSISEHCLLAQEIFHKFKLSKNRKGLMALKLDMEQAYDNVRFSIIINGRNSNWISAGSGFRQGCPLSPYLLILCSQLLSSSLEQRGKNLGIRIAPRGPRISHLLYVDDVLVLSHVSTTLAKEMKTIVEDFCKWTGQRVNINKSQVLFGKMVSHSLKKKITRIIGFKEVKEMKYLGVKISLRRNKVTDF
ncbi:hypothetical protein KFK09_007180 [Dendrobium nobile]|uniref:Reverse transcriptase domain-containing protein n=1 Tax=Dendrobium nobile TaxID=94219 RepID=A0A8T3BVR9_DENNO|nr:hypothetical protein KFK09_007180 [Dendrobium nobile]